MVADLRERFICKLAPALNRPLGGSAYDTRLASIRIWHTLADRTALPAAWRIAPIRRPLARIYIAPSGRNQLIHLSAS